MIVYNEHVELIGFYYLLFSLIEHKKCEEFDNNLSELTLSFLHYLLLVQFDHFLIILS
jgi:hypothetical protein